MGRVSLHSLGERAIVQPEFITQLLDKHLPTHPGFYGDMVGILLVFERWMRAHEARQPV